MLLPFVPEWGMALSSRFAIAPSLWILALTIQFSGALG